MRWFESQIDTRARLDEELTERTYAELAASVSNSRMVPVFHMDDLEQAAGAAKTCLRHLGVEPGMVPDNVSDIDEQLECLCRPSGTMRRNVALPDAWYKDASGTMMGKLDSGEAVALLPGVMNGYFYHEPGTGRKVRVTKRNAKHIEREAVLFYRPLPSRALTMKDLVSFIFTSFDKGDYVWVLVAAAVVTLVGLLPAWVNQIAFGTVIPSGQESLIAPIAVLLATVSISVVVIGMCRNLIMSRVSLKMSVCVEAATFARLLSLPTSFFKNYASGNLAQRISQMTLLIETLTSLILGAGLTAAFSLLYVFQVAAYTPSLALPAILIVIIQAVFLYVATVVTMGYERRTMDANARLSGTVTALLSGIQKIKLAGAEDRAFAKWGKSYAEYARPAYNRPALLRALPAVVTALGMLGTTVIYFFAGSSHVSMADFMSFSVAYGQMATAILGVAQLATQFAQIEPMIEMVAPILECVPEPADDKPSVRDLNGAIEVSGLSFRYNDDSPLVLNDLSFRVKPGEYVALVGKSGCGKSTLMRLLLGFEQPEHGSIFYGPYDVSKVDLRSLRSHIGTVMQDGKLFMGNISSNITISSPSSTLDDAWEAAELAGIADDIRKMPMGMQTMVTEGGGGVSGGQRQRIMIARAICGKKRVLMFDEATSALDNKTQRHVSDSLDSLKCTRVVVAHRLSTVRHCDRILVLDGGHIVEEGTYDELIAQGGAFAELVARQRLDKEA